MAVIQISKIQHRRGAIGEQGMPQLASGELGWAVDTQQLFIGNGSVAEGAPAVGNTEVLTQYSTATINLFNYIYEYQGGKADVTTFQPYTVSRSLQNKLDDYVSVLDFGADPTGTNPCDHAIQTAVTATYMNSHDSGSDLSYRKILHFPAGTYKITGTVYLPPYISIQGEGADNTLLKTVNTTGNNTIFRTRSIDPVTKDFLKPFGSLSQPVPGVSITDMSFAYDNSVPIYTPTTVASALLNLDMTTYSEVRNCKFQGTYTNLFGTGPDVVNQLGQIPVRYAGIYITGATTTNLEIDNNEFNGLIMGTFCYQDNKYVTYSNNIYDTLYYGILAGSFTITPTNVTGGLYNRAVNNKFLNINRTGISVNIPPGATTTTGFISDGNLFSNVGNGITGNESGQITECITFGQATGCVSINDKFTRFDQAQTTYSTSTFFPLVYGKAITVNDAVTYQYPIKWTSTATLIRIPYLTTMTGVVMEYQLQKTTGIRKGVLKVTASPYQVGTVTYTDQYNYFGTEPGVVLTAKLINSTNSNITTVFDCIAIQYENDRNTNFPSNTGTGLISLTVKYQT